MDDKSRLHLTKDIIECYDSLLRSIFLAGGCIEKDKLLNMTVLELISTLSTNHIKILLG